MNLKKLLISNIALKHIYNLIFKCLPGLDGERDLDLSSSLAVFDLGDIHRRGDDLGDRLRPGEEGDIFLFLFLSLESFFLVLPLSDID